MKCFLQTAYCGCSLRTGTLFIGALSIVVSMVAFPFKTVESERFIEGYSPYTIYALSVSSIAILTSILLIAGATKEKKWLLVPWITFSLMAISSYTYSLFLQTYFEEYNRKYGNGHTTELNKIEIIIMGGVLCVNIYSLLVVMSYFKELDERDLGIGVNPGKVYFAQNPEFSSSHHIISTTFSGQAA